MARKTLGKMEFEQLIDSLKEQNKGQLAAQQETTKSIRSLQAYFLKQDRIDTRRRLEDQMEQRRDAEKVPGKQKGLFDKKIPTKGIFGKLMDFFLTGALGTAGKSLFRSLWSGVKFSGGFFKGLAGFMGGLILAPQIWDSIKKGLDEGDSVTDVVDKSVSYFLKNTSLVEGMSAAALIGLGVAGPKGAVAAAITFGALKGVSSIIGDEKTVGDFFTGNVGTFESALAGTALGAISGFTIGSKFGLKGAVAGLLLGAGLGALGGVLMSKDTNINPFSIMMSVIGGFGGGLLGLKAGAMLGAVGGPVGMIAGALLGAALGLALGSLATDESKTSKTVKSIAKRAQQIKDLEEKQVEGTITEKEKGELASLKGAQDIDVGALDKTTLKGDIAKLALLTGDSDMMQSFTETMYPAKIKQWREKFNERFNTNMKSIGEYVDYSVKEGVFKWKKDLTVKVEGKPKTTIKAGTLFDDGITQAGERFQEFRLNDILIPAYSASPFSREFSDARVKAYQEDGPDVDEQPYYDAFMKAANYARGYGAFDVPQLIQVGDQPKSQGQELVLTEKKFNRIINDIMENNRLKRDKEDMNIGMARNQGAPPIMPQVTNNNVSNQNVLQTEIMPSFNFDIMRDALPA